MGVCDVFRVVYKSDATRSNVIIKDERYNLDRAYLNIWHIML